MKVLLLGGTGLLSSGIAREAIRNGIDVWTLSRGSDWKKQFLDDRVHRLYGDIRDPKNIEGLLKDHSFDVVVDFISFTPDNVRNKICLLRGKYKQYILISSVAAYNNEDCKQRMTESSIQIGNNECSYGWNKCLCECYLREYFRNNREAVFTIVRPGYTYGDVCVPYWLTEGFTLRGWLFINRIINQKPVPVLGEEYDICTLTHVNDFSKGVVGLFLNEKAYGDDFHITSDEITSWSEVLLEIEKKIGIKIKRKKINPDDFMMLLPECTEQIVMASKKMVFNNSKIKKAVPTFSCDITINDGIKSLVDFFDKNVNESMMNISEVWEERIFWEKKIEKLVSI